MKKLILFLLFSIGLQAQNKIDQIIYTQPIKGLIEIDGHVFKGDTLKNKIRYEATLSFFTILDDKNKYQVRRCNTKDCTIIHLEPKKIGISIYNGGNLYLNNTKGL